jgi:hypothetical protein
MKQQEVFRKIGGIIKELNEQYEYLQAAPGHLNDLELELFLANSHFLADHLLILTKLNSQSGAAQKPEALQPEKYFEPLVQPIVPAKDEEKATEEFKPAIVHEDNPVPSINLDGGEPKDNFSYIRDEEPETIRHELIMDEADLGDDEDELYEDEDIVPVADEDEDVDDVPPVPLKPVTATNEEIKPVIEEPAVPEKTIEPEKAPEYIKQLAEAIKPTPEPAKADVLTINEKMSAQLAGKSGGVTDNLHAQKISDLKSAITLNDKLLYIKDLFNGYSLAYSEAIEILNRFTSFEEAETFLRKNYVVKNEWESKPETNAKFYGLLKHRYE